MPNILILYQSKTGHTAAIAEAVAAGTDSVKSISAKSVKIRNFTEEDIIQAHAVIIGSPVYYGSIDAEVLASLDALYPLKNQLYNKIGAGFVTGSHNMGGKETALLSIIQGLLMLGLVIIGDPKNTTGPFGFSCIGPPGENDLRNASEFGKRVAEFLISRPSA